MVDTAELVAVLHRVDELLDRPETDVVWSSYDSAEEIQAEIARYIERAMTSDLSPSDRQGLIFLFLPTGPLQEVSISSGWAEEYLALSDRFDKAIGYEGVAGRNEGAPGHARSRRRWRSSPGNSGLRRWLRP